MLIDRGAVRQGILNVTPDSFSDGGRHWSPDGSTDALIATALDSCRQMLEDGADMIDIGGQSTRPGAAEVAEAEERRRTIPLILALRSAGISAPISIDTYRAAVAEEAIAAGADMINDVSGGRQSDGGTLRVAARHGVPIVLMHMRGDSRSMARLTDYSATGGVVAAVIGELAERRDSAVRSGVWRWNVILDPGLGFAKNAEQNYELLRSLPSIVHDSTLRGHAMLLGPSRKRFLGVALAERAAQGAPPTQPDRTPPAAPDHGTQPLPPPELRDWATAAAVAASIRGGAALVRVHRVRAMRDVAAAADAIWRPVSPASASACFECRAP